MLGGLPSGRSTADGSCDGALAGCLPQLMLLLDFFEFAAGSAVTTYLIHGSSLTIVLDS